MEEIRELDQPIRTWFELTYAQYLTVPRSIMESMNDDWQKQMKALLDELDGTYDWRPSEGRYWVILKDEKGRYVRDHLREYRHPDYKYIESIKTRP